MSKTIEIDGSDKKWYVPILIWRPLLILCVIIGHSFAIYSGTWSYDFKLIKYIPEYSWINPLFISFQLEAFFFISGYLFWMKETSEIITTPKALYKYIKKKFLRLYFPAIVFSLLYLYFFTINPTGKDVIEALILGKGHLWFLPAIFWCSIIHRFLAKWSKKHIWFYFLGSFVLIYIGIGTYVLLPTVCTRLFSVVTKYYFFYVLGTSIRLILPYWGNNKLEKRKLYNTGKWILILFATFAVFHLLGEGIKSRLYMENNVLPKLLKIAIGPIKALAATLAMYLIWIKMENINYSKRSIITWRYLSGISFGMYIIHQFVIVETLNHHISFFNNLVGPYMIPFVLLVLGVVVSFAIVETFKKILL